ncbi:MAG: hypothetical protein ACLU9R_13175 [Faecalibacterium sp.]
MIVEILCGGYGCPTKTGVHTVSRGERCEVSDAEAARLIGLGVAKCAFSAPTAPEAAPADVPATVEGNAEASQNGSEAAHLDPDQLHDMTVANLKKLAADMGIDTKQLKTKDALIQAICAEDVAPGDECTDGPELAAAMPTA